MVFEADPYRPPLSKELLCSFTSFDLSPKRAPLGPFGIQEGAK